MPFSAIHNIWFVYESYIGESIDDIGERLVPGRSWRAWTIEGGRLSFMEQKAPPPPFRLSLISWAAARPSVHDASDAELGWIENRPERSGRFMAHARGRLQCLASSSLRRSFCFRSEERRVGTECVKKCRTRWSP